jgi:tetratricopeptide (TPR) repeat protein
VKILLFTIFSALLLVGIGDIAEINRLKKEAEQAYLNGNFSTAISHYHTLLDSFKVSDENIRLNLANAYLQDKDTATAQQYYRQLANTPDREVKSLAQQQMGIVAHQQQKLQEALQHFKEALKADPTNEDARYNYELLKKKLQEQQDQQENDQNQQKNDENQEQQENKEQEKQDQNQQEQKQDQEQQKQDQQQQEQNQQEGQEQESENQQQQEQEKQQKEQNQGEQEEGESQEQKEEPIIPTAERLEDMNMSEEKARMILEAMRNNELQYIQQNRRKANTPPDRNKPDW